MERRIAELHMAQARERALRLFTLSSTLFPEEWTKQLDELAVVDLVEFAIHARRLTELCELRGDQFPGVDESRFRYTVAPSTPFEKDYHEALNFLIHAKTYTIGHSIFEGEKFYKASANNLIVSYVQITTDRKPKKCVSIFGLVFCFLNPVVAKIKAKHPELIF